jgi:hypothetical protein
MMRFLAVFLVVVAATSAFANDKPNTLTPQEITDGWLLLFDGETTFGWKVDVSKVEAARGITAKDGSLVIRGKQGAYFTTAFHRFELRGEYRTSGKGNQIAVELRSPSVGIEMGDGLRPSEKEWRSLTVRLSQRDMLVMAGEPGKSGVSGPNVSPDAVAVIGFRLANDDDKIELRNLKLRPLGTQPLFSGRNLDGWQVNAADPKRMSAKFAVTKDGELSVKNGPGDLVTAKEFENFVLQLECKTLGKGLNSGIFFRCIPGQYQNGYEAQIQNLYKGDDRTKPADYGTGAIYRRVPARRVVSNDNEWFTMTIAANGKHIATWVNGYQTVAWTDDRKESDNPRQGYRAAKGPISIQAHDPTTDLLFRNIRVAEIPTK